MITFLFSVQGDHLHTTIPDGRLFGITSDWFSGFYVGLGIGAAGFSLKWKAVHWPEEDEADDLDLLRMPPASSTLPSGSVPAEYRQEETPRECVFQQGGSQYEVLPT